MDNTELKTEADLLIRSICLAELLASYPAWFIGGSYSYDLMCWRDLDIYVLDPGHDLKRCFEIGYEITQRLAARKCRFSNNLGNVDGSIPDGLYWGIKLGDIRQGAWKWDVWFQDHAGYEEHAGYSAAMRDRLTPSTRSIIMAKKQAYWQRPSYRDTVTSDMIYRAVLDSGVSNADEFARFARAMAPPHD